MESLSVNALRLALLGMLASCSKTPEASFTSDKAEYENGDVMKMTNTSKNAHTYNWSVSNSLTQYSGKDAEIITNGQGEYEVTLTAFARYGGKSDKITKKYLVKPGNGQLLFYAPDVESLSDSILIDDEYQGTPAKTYSVPPDCGAPGCIEITLLEGEYLYVVKRNGVATSFAVEVLPGVCKKIRL